MKPPSNHTPRQAVAIVQRGAPLTPTADSVAE
jgi:hypothetical protein